MPQINLGLAVDTTDRLARGYPASLSFTGTMEEWQPAASQVEMRTLRASSAVSGPRPHGRARALVEERFSLVLPTSSTVIEQASRIFNDINDGRASAYLTAVRAGDSTITWRSPIYAGDMELSADSQRWTDRTRYTITCARAPWWENAAAAQSVGSATLASRTVIAYTAPTSGTIAAPIEWTLSATASTGAAMRVHLWQDRHAPHGQGLNWSAAYLMSASSSTKNTGEYRHVNFSTAAPSGKNLGYALVYQPVFMPSSATNAGVVRSNRGSEGLTLKYGKSATNLAGESDVGVLGKLGGHDSIFTGLGLVTISETTDYHRIIAYADKISGTGWRLAMSPTDGYIARQYSEAFSGTAPTPPSDTAAHYGDEAIWLSPGERCIVYPLIETLGASGAEYASATNLTLAGALRPRISEL